MQRSRRRRHPDGGESNETFSKRGALVGIPPEGPVGLALGEGDDLDGLEEELALLEVPDVGVDEEGVRLGVDVPRYDLEAVQAANWRIVRRGSR
jgi:hypothetical protein